jgi:hypothetical protein
VVVVIAALALFRFKTNFVLVITACDLARLLPHWCIETTAALLQKCGPNPAVNGCLAVWWQAAVNAATVRLSGRKFLNNLFALLIAYHWLALLSRASAALACAALGLTACASGPTAPTKMDGLCRGGGGTVKVVQPQSIDTAHMPYLVISAVWSLCSANRVDLNQSKKISCHV